MTELLASEVRSLVRGRSRARKLAVVYDPVEYSPTVSDDKSFYRDCLDIVHGDREESDVVRWGRDWSSPRLRQNDAVLSVFISTRSGTANPLPGFDANEVYQVVIDRGPEGLKRLLCDLRANMRQDSFKDFRGALEGWVRITTPPDARSTGRTEAPVCAWLAGSQRLHAFGRTSAALDIVYDAIDDLFRRNQFEQVDRLLDSIEVEEMPLDLLLALLTATLPAKSKLAGRADFFARVESCLKAQGRLEPDLLIGLGN